MAEKRYLDVDEGLARVRGNKTLYGRMLQLFLNGAEYDAFEEALAQEDYTKASEVAHTIKGITGNLSMPAMFEASAQLMGQLREGPADEATLADYRQALVATREAAQQFLQES